MSGTVLSGLEIRRRQFGGETMFKVAKGLVLLCAYIFTGVVGASAQEPGPVLHKIKAAGAITIGHRTNSIPLSYLDADQKPVGFSLDLCALVVEKVKQTLALPELKVNYQPVTPSTSIPLVQNGAVDIECGATANTAQAQQQAAFSITTYQPELRWLVSRKLRVEGEGRSRRRRETRVPETAGDLRGKTVVLTQGAKTNLLVLTLSNDNSLGLSIMNGKDEADSFQLMESGRAVAFLDDDVLLLGLKANSKNPDAFTFLEDAYPSDPYALMFRKDDKAFKELVDGVLIAVMKSGEYEKLYAKWFESPIPPKNVNLAYPMSDELKKLIKESGDKANGK
jgi:glutamate/aspartate transport system substrate-binding protein